MTKPLTALTILCLFASLLGVALPPAARAQDTERVAAVVNEDAITMRDLEERVRLVLLSSGLPDTPETRNRIAPQVLRRLIDEHLQTQEAKRLKISIPQRSVDNGIANIELQNKMPKGSFEPFLKAHGIDPDTIHQQITAEIAWYRVVHAELQPQVHIGDDEIDTRLATLRANRGKPEYLAAEIFLSVDSPQRDEEERTLAIKLLEQMHQGVHFSALARQFSQSGAASGGDLGWVSQGMLDDALFQSLTTLHVGEVSAPIRLADGYHILLLRAKRVAGEGEGLEPTVDLASINLFPLPDATPADKNEQLALLQRAIKNARTCDDYEQAIKKVPNADWNQPGKLKLSQLPPELKTLAAKMQKGNISEPMKEANLTRILVMCDRIESVDGLPSRDDIEQRMEDERVELLAQRYLRDLRRSAFIEIRG